MATDMARRMVMEWGLSDKLGFQAFNSSSDDPYAANKPKPYSGKTAELIDQEVKNLLDECYTNTKKLLEEKKHELIILAEALLEHETLSGDEIKSLLENGKITASNTKQPKARSTVPSVSD